MKLAQFTRRRPCIICGKAHLPVGASRLCDSCYHQEYERLMEQQPKEMQIKKDETK